VSEPLYRRVGSRKNEPNVAVIGPLDEVRRSPVGSVDLQDLRVAIMFAFVVALDDKSGLRHVPASFFLPLDFLHNAPGQVHIARVMGLVLWRRGWTTTE
jgi:hypothetical protein